MRIAAAQDRGPPAAIELLLPVWGAQYVSHFLTVSLPTLLASGNIPNLAARLPCRFVFITRAQDIQQIRQSRSVEALARICDVDFRPVDDLIMRGNHSTTVTLAYGRHVHSMGAAALNTCFFFLVSDYVVADGSLGHVLDRMMAGASGVVAGNFQVTPSFNALLLGKRRDEEPPLVRRLPPRDLLEKAFRTLHPITVANTVNLPFSHNAHCNRLFWRVDEHTMVGRFYLMHMICIRPEVEEFFIGASCDYCFVPEMCPSGNVVAMADSDKYLVVEAQPLTHEAGSLRAGPLRPRDFAAHLTEWTTKEHRQNAEVAVIFHSRDLSSAAENAVVESGKYVAEIARLLTGKPKPHLRHPYWGGAVVAYIESRPERTVPADLASIVIVGSPYRRRVLHLIQRVRYALFGHAPEVRRWHPLWPEFHHQLKWVRGVLPGPGERLIAIAGDDAPLVGWAAKRAAGVEKVAIADVKDRMAAARRAGELFDAALVQVTDNEAATLGGVLECIQPRLKDGARVVVIFANNLLAGDARRFEQQILLHNEAFVRRGLMVLGSEFIYQSALRTGVTRRLVRLGIASMSHPILFAPLAAVLSPVLTLLTFVANIASFHPKGRDHRPISTMLVSLKSFRTLEAPEDEIAEEPEPCTDEVSA